MSKVWKVDAFYDTDSGFEINTIGLFTDIESANYVIEKWLKFHEVSMTIFNEPDGWNPKSDKWYSEDPRCGFEWQDSYQYDILKDKYKKLLYFREIFIEEWDLDKDIYINSQKDDIEYLAIQFNRDYELNKILD